MNVRDKLDLENFDDFDNISFTVVTPEIKPLFWIENGKPRSGYKKLEEITINFPKSTKFFSQQGYDVGTLNEKIGNYSGLLGVLQRGECDAIFNPLPLGFEGNNEFQYSIALYTSGFGTFSMVRYPLQKTNDLTNCFFDFKMDVISVFLFFYFLIILIMAYFFSMKLKESALIIYRIMFKEHNLKMEDPIYRHFLVPVLLYYLLLNIIIEQNVNTNLVVSQSADYIDTIDQIYNNKKLQIHFLNGHYTLEYFRNSFGDKKLKDIYDRAWVHDQKDYLPLVYHENEKLLSTPNHLIIIDDTISIYFRKRKAICNNNCEWIIKKGIVYSSPVFIHQLFAFVNIHFQSNLNKAFRKNLPKRILNSFINIKLMRFVENGISLYFEKNVKGQIFGFIKNTSPPYEQCRNANSISTLDNNSYGKIKIANVIRFVIAIITFYSLLSVVCFLNYIFIYCTMKQKRKVKSASVYEAASQT